MRGGRESIREKRQWEKGHGEKDRERDQKEKTRTINNIHECE